MRGIPIMHGVIKKFSRLEFLWDGQTPSLAAKAGEGDWPFKFGGHAAINSGCLG